jgi:hypothetical protein
MKIFKQYTFQISYAQCFSKHLNSFSDEVLLNLKGWGPIVSLRNYSWKHLEMQRKSNAYWTFIQCFLIFWNLLFLSLFFKSLPSWSYCVGFPLGTNLHRQQLQVKVFMQNFTHLTFSIHWRGSSPVAGEGVIRQELVKFLLDFFYMWNPKQ